MIIVEGPDGSGKSTLVRSLSADLGLPIEPKAVDDHGVPMTDLMGWTTDQLRHGFRGVLYDRFNLISDPIYRPFLDKWNAPMYDPTWMKTRMAALYALKPIIIYCLPDLSTVMYNVSFGEDDNSAIIEFADKLWYAYSARMAVDLATSHVDRHIAYHFDYQRVQYNFLSSDLRRLLSQRKSDGN